MTLVIILIIVNASRPLEYMIAGTMATSMALAGAFAWVSRRRWQALFGTRIRVGRTESSGADTMIGE